MKRIGIVLLLAACGGGQGDVSDVPDTAAQTPPAATTAMPMSVSVEQFAQLRWLEGTWRGSGVEQPTFYERYSFADDSTIRAESSPDSTFPHPEEASAIQLRAGRVTTGEGTMEWALTSLDATSVRFDPVRNARNTFVWRRDGDSAWTATLSWTEQGERCERVYDMRRMP